MGDELENAMQEDNEIEDDLENGLEEEEDMGGGDDELAEGMYAPAGGDF